MHRYPVILVATGADYRFAETPSHNLDNSISSPKSEETPIELSREALGQSIILLRCYVFVNNEIRILQVLDSTG